MNSVMLTDDSYAMAKGIAMQYGQTIDKILNNALAMYAQHLEDEEDIADTERICQAIDSGEMETYPLEDVKRYIDADATISALDKLCGNGERLWTQDPQEYVQGIRDGDRI